jgi:hypothetical protein
VKYENYKRFGSNVKITYEGQEVQKGQDQNGGQQPQQAPQQPQQTPQQPQAPQQPQK